MTRLFTILEAAIDAVVRGIILPVTGAIPVLVRTGVLFAGFAALWIALLAAMVLQPATLDAVWAWLTGLALPLQGLAWLLFLPLTGALWAWSFDWPIVVRVVIVLAIATWNLLVFLPHRETGATDASTAAPTANSSTPAATTTTAEA